MSSVHPVFFSASTVVNSASSEYLQTSDAAHTEALLSFALFTLHLEHGMWLSH